MGLDQIDLPQDNEYSSVSVSWNPAAPMGLGMPRAISGFGVPADMQSQGTLQPVWSIPVNNTIRARRTQPLSTACPLARPRIGILEPAMQRCTFWPFFCR